MADEPMPEGVYQDTPEAGAGEKRQSPPVRDSDLIYLAIKRLEVVADKMMRLEYDETLDQLMQEAADWFEWAAWNMAERASKQEQEQS